jgi:hypothetical protein
VAHCANRGFAVLGRVLAVAVWLGDAVDGPDLSWAGDGDFGDELFDEGFALDGVRAWDDNSSFPELSERTSLRKVIDLKERDTG